jgi:hypothetical protein
VEKDNYKRKVEKKALPTEETGKGKSGKDMKKSGGNKQPS